MPTRFRRRGLIAALALLFLAAAGPRACAGITYTFDQANPGINGGIDGVNYGSITISDHTTDPGSVALDAVRFDFAVNTDSATNGGLSNPKFGEIGINADPSVSLSAANVTTAPANWSTS